jgi:hypothetical protein
MIGLSNALTPSIDTIGLQVAIGPATLWLNGTVIISPFSYVYLSNNSTTYIYLNTTSGQIGANNSGYASGNIPIATVITNLTRVTSLIDTRPDFTNIGSATGSGGTVWADVSSSGTFVPTSLNQSINASGTISIALTAVAGQIYNVVNTGNGVITLTTTASATIYELVNQNQAVQISYDITSTTFRVLGGN